MNYYIQGDAANADKIKAAFEKLGYNTGNLGFTSSQLYYTIEGKVELIGTKALQNLIKTHPDYQELELQVEPKFKVNNWIVRGEGFVYEPSLITEIRDYYICELLNGERVTYTLNDVHKNFHLWTIADAKDGDVLSSIRGCPFIYDKYRNQRNNLLYYYAGIDGNGDFVMKCPEKMLYHFGPSTDAVPATKEQRDMLFAKMREAGYLWDAEKKELKKIQPHYDITNFKPFDKVLVRDEDDGKWVAAFYSHYMNEEKDYPYQFATIGTDIYGQCVPFEGNEHLFGTTKMPSEEFINWQRLNYEQQ